MKTTEITYVAELESSQTPMGYFKVKGRATSSCELS